MWHYDAELTPYWSLTAPNSRNELAAEMHTQQLAKGVASKSCI